MIRNIKKEAPKQKSQWLAPLAFCDCFFLSLVGMAGFELATPCTPCKCATRLRYTPTSARQYSLIQWVSRSLIDNNSSRTWTEVSVSPSEASVGM
jgi:hypothetical protein